MKFTFFLILSTIYYLLFTVSNLHAADFSLSISPPLTQITAHPPANIKTPITIQNQSDETIELDILFKPFGASENKDEEDSSILDKIQITNEGNFIQSLALSPKQEKKLFLRIDIPENEKEKDYYFSIQFISKPSAIKDDSNYSQILAGIATNVLVSIRSENAKAASDRAKTAIEEFFAPLFLEKGPVPFTVKIKNAGSHFITTQGIVTIRNVFGQLVGKVDLVPMNILRDSSRSTKVFWHESFMLGFYTATLNVAVSDQYPALTRSIHLFAIPTQGIIIAVVTIFIVFLIYNSVKKRLSQNSL